MYNMYNMYYCLLSAVLLSRHDGKGSLDRGINRIRNGQVKYLYQVLADTIWPSQHKPSSVAGRPQRAHSNSSITKRAQLRGYP